MSLVSPFEMINVGWQVISRKERFAEFLRRLMAVEPACDFDEAYSALCQVLNDVEDDLSGVPYNPESWRTDGRLYPPQRDAFRESEKDATVTRIRTRGHNVFIGPNGAIEIQVLGGEVIFEKPGEDGEGVWK